MLFIASLTLLFIALDSNQFMKPSSKYILWKVFLKIAACTTFCISSYYLEFFTNFLHLLWKLSIELILAVFQEWTVGLLIGSMLDYLLIKSLNFGVKLVDEILVYILSMYFGHKLVLFILITLVASFVLLHIFGSHFPEAFKNPEFLIVRTLFGFLNSVFICN